MSDRYAQAPGTASPGDPAPAEDRSSPERSPPERGGAERSGAERGSAPLDRGGFLSAVLGLWKPRETALSRADVVEALLGADDVFAPEERAMLTNILGLRDLRVADVMVPRADIEAIEIRTTLGDLMRAFEDSGRSRMPVFRETLDEPLGMIHIRDVVGHVTRTALGRADAPEPGPDLSLIDLSRIDLSRPLAELDLVREILFVPPRMHAAKLMARMQAAHIQMALVIDEYGGTDGLVSLEDVLEMVVGDIADEHDDEEAPIVERDGGFVVEAHADLVEVRRRIGGDFDIAPHEERADTIGGLLFSALGRVAVRGEVVEPVPGFSFEVLDADPRRVRRVRIARRPNGGDTHLRLVGDSPPP